MLDLPSNSPVARILICEEEATTANDIAETLKQLGYEVVGMVYTGEEAVRTAEEAQPDLILMDITLAGEIDGIEAAEQIRSCLDIPIVYLTEHAEKDTFERAKKTEPYGYLGKPIRLPEFRSTVETALQKHESDKRLRESEERYRRIFNNIQDVYCETLLDGTIVEISPSIERLSAYTRDELIGASVLDFHAFPEQRQTMLKMLLEVGSVSDYEAFYKDKDGTLFPVSASIKTVCDDRGKPWKFCGSFRIIADRKTAEEQINASLKEKEVLLREIHHRVKNNLAVVSSLLFLQSRHAKDEYHRGMFIESADRIRSMAMAHDKLYRAENLSAINSEAYLTGLVGDLMSSLGHVGSHIEFQLQIVEVDLDLETGVALGLIVTELVSNCLKHAFPNDGAGNISIALKEIDDSTLELSVADDGVGLPQNVQLDKPNTLGLDLVRILSRQLNSHLEMRRDRGTEIVLRFSRRP